eukprot:TRINITY_DN2314_c0_g1_i1.p1 TRINITY_DN2314_c0_g1~~TRINITY_DN2314_c0_g1_i1.p1  ORF type:complete len:727 (-),score=171.48 TRINITY_DN2314_c0_g1_i1:43-2223(-)
MENETSPGKQVNDLFEQRKALQAGSRGLKNLGNSCFMNSALQLLAHVPPFVSTVINTPESVNSNLPLSSSFRRLLKMIWEDKDSGEVLSYIDPSFFRTIAGSLSEQFVNQQQQDPQEFLSLFLDGLHEELKISKDVQANAFSNDSIETCEGLSPLEQEVQQKSSAAWKAYIHENKSIITDLFHGQLLSSLACAHCKKILSYTFDPFVFLSLPIPTRNERFFKILFVENIPYQEKVSCDAKIKIFGVKISKYAKVKDLKNILLAKLHEKEGLGSLKEQEICLAEVRSNKIFSIYDENKDIGIISKEDDIFCFQIADCPQDSSQMLKPTTTATTTTTTAEPSNNPSDQSSTGGALLPPPPPPTLALGRGWVKIGAPKTPSFFKCVHRVITKDNQSFYFDGIPFIVSSKSSFQTNFSIQLEIKKVIQSHALFFNSKKKDWKKRDDESKNKEKDGDDEVNQHHENVWEELMDDNSEPPYVVKIVNTGGTSCAVCAFSKKCSGCLLDEDQSSLSTDLSKPRLCLAVEWKEDVWNEIFDISKPVAIPEETQLDQPLNGKQLLSSDNMAPNKLASFHGKEVHMENGFEEEWKEERLTLQDCLDQFEADELLDIKRSCPACQKEVEVMKKLTIHKPPPIMIVHLKRFPPMMTSYKEKIDTYVDFPLNHWNMKNGYHCVAVSNNTTRTGVSHYTTHALNHLDKKWYYFDDVVCLESTEGKVKSSDAYLVVYSSLG